MNYDRAFKVLGEIKDSLAPEATVDRIITEAEKAASDATLDDAAQTLQRCGHVTAARMLLALKEDRKAMRAGKPTAYPALRESVPLRR